MKAMNREAVASLPKVYEWRLREAAALPTPIQTAHTRITEANVLLQLRNLTLPRSVRTRGGSVDLHGWVYHIGTGAVTCTMWLQHIRSGCRPLRRPSGRWQSEEP